MPTKKAPELVVEETTEKEEQNALFDVTRKVMLASIGAVALAQEEIEDFIGRLIERGEIAEQDGRKLVREVMDKRKEEAHKAEDKAKQMEGKVNKRVESMLSRFSLATKSDVQALDEQIAQLSKKLDNLN